MTTPVVLIDGGHLLAAIGRALGLGPRRVDGQLDVVALVKRVRRLVPGEGAPPVHWFDGVIANRSSHDHDQLSACSDLTLVTTPVRAGRQRDLELLLLRQALQSVSGGRDVYLAGDPRRHAIALDMLAAAGCRTQVVGVAGGELTPAKRMWLRRPDLGGLVLPAATGQGARRGGPPGYVPPEILASGARPGAFVPGRRP